MVSDMLDISQSTESFCANRPGLCLYHRREVSAKNADFLWPP